MPSASIPLSELTEHPIVQAPMAGGPSCPELAGSVSEAGGMGFLAAGYKTPEAMYEEIKQLRGQTQRPFGVNLFMPQPDNADSGALERYRAQLAGEATWYEAQLGETDHTTDDAYEAKLAILFDDPVPVVSFTFGCPTRHVLERFTKRGTYTVVTVTSAGEAQTAEFLGADAVCVQGIEAGGHQGTHRDDPQADGTGSGLGLLTLVTQVKEAVRLPVVAAGGLMRGKQIAAVLAAGASAAQLGTAFLVCPESGAELVHKQAMTNPLFARTEFTRAFSGRPARALVNRFLREHGPYAPAAYPQVHHLTAGVRKAAAKAKDPQGMALWAGQGHKLARDLPAAQLMDVLVTELAVARDRVAKQGAPGGSGGGTGGPV
ncbi:2-nitropropane dioxygenase [Streptomyces abyssalis]|uniref:Probable nitronate monooxygenase n=1 Tax=Streptomyces abyssalis TaxID=933944 RepID=A0A1E7JK12_9ACTN|nr:nitronate monooxygenase [Streptomyces abyssalis]OEU85043.1 2-nitropropane dioxygenase [Streptomyces abyssalis]OEU87965.1 2-nitropropane dioxygenase [Streptomyces abyssalis]OEV28597.1 2-nitropropane dioxygenase [Streptomyces nanshensis]